VKAYRVGGCVRDRLLEKPVNDIDWVVTGSTVEDMKAAGFKPIGKDFPVFLHPESKQEYALARSERKTAPGYRGFEFIIDPTITIEQDLSRRDLTINSMAEDEDGQIIDPYGGQGDLKSRTLRHVSLAFVEDPVRVLRVARFAARYHHLGFKIADETIDLMREMGQSGELDSLIAERVWSEMSRALSEPDPAIFFESLRNCDALKILFPEIDALYGVPQTAKYHPEIDTGIHTLMVLQQAALLTEDTTTRFAALCHDLGKGLTPKDNWPRHPGHEIKGVKPIRDLCNRLRIPNQFKELAVITAEFHLHTHRAFEIKKSTLLTTIEKLDGMRKPERYENFLIACTADLKGRPGYELLPYPQADYYRSALRIIKSIDVKAIVSSGLKGKAISDAIHKERLSALNQQLHIPADL